MNIPSDKLNEISDQLFTSDVGIVSVFKTRDVAKKQYHSYIIGKDMFNWINHLDSHGFEPTGNTKLNNIRFNKTSGYLTDGQPFEFTMYDRIRVPKGQTPEIVFKGIDTNIINFFKLSTSNVLKKFEKINCIVDHSYISSSGDQSLTVDLRTRSEYIYIPKPLDEYCYENNHDVAVCINGKKIPNTSIYVMSNGSFTDFFIDTVWVKSILNFDEISSLAEDFELSVDVFNHKDTRSEGSLNKYRSFAMLKDSKSSTVSFTNVPVERAPLNRSDVEGSIADRTLLTCNGIYVNVVSVEITNNEDDPNYCTVDIVTDTHQELISDIKGKFTYEYQYIHSVKYRYFDRGLVVDEDVNLTPSVPNSVNYSVYIERQDDGSYLLSLFVNDSLSDTYSKDIIKGSIPIGALTVFLDGRKVTVNRFKQTSRFSYTVEFLGDGSIFEENNNTEFSFIIEDKDEAILENNGTYYDTDLIQYGQDYYLANFLGTARAHQYAYNNDAELTDPHNYGAFLNRAIELEREIVPEQDRRIIKDGIVNDNYFKNILGSRDCISTIDSDIDLLDPKKNEDLIKTMWGKSSDGYTINKLTEYNPSLTRELLSNFSVETVYDYLLSSNVPEVYTKSINISDYTKPYIKVFLNRRLLNDARYNLEKDEINHSYHVHINKSEFITSDRQTQPNFNYLNVVEIQITESVNSRLQVMRLFDDTITPMDSGISLGGNGRLTITMDCLKSFFGEDVETSTQQLTILRRIGKDYTGLIYGEGNYGWISLRDSNKQTVVFRFENNSLYIDNIIDIVGDRNNLKDLYIYDTKFYYHKSMYVTKDDTFNVFKVTMKSIQEANLSDDLINYNGTDYSDLSGIPIISGTVPELYVNGSIWTINNDYEYVTPLDNDLLATSVMIVKSVIEDNSPFVFDFVEAHQDFIVDNTDCYIKNKHGLLYFKDLEYPFSLDYLDLFINGKKVSPCDITILSDKMIRVGNIFNNSKDETEYGPIVWKSGFNSVKLSTKFAIGKENVKELSSNFVISDMEYLLELLFHNINPGNTEADDRYPTEDEIDEGYKTFISKVDDFGGVEFGMDNPVIPEGDSLISAYLEWLVKSKTTRSHALCNPEDPKRTYIRDYVLDYFSIYENISENGYDIVVNSGERNIFGNDIIVNIVAGVGESEETKKKLDLYPRTYKSTTNRQIFDHFEDLRSRLNESSKDIYDYSGEILTDVTNNNVGDSNRFMKTVFTDYTTSGFSNIMYKEDYPVSESLVSENGIIEVGFSESEDPRDYLGIGEDIESVTVEQLNIDIDTNKIF